MPVVPMALMLLPTLPCRRREGRPCSYGGHHACAACPWTEERKAKFAEGVRQAYRAALSPGDPGGPGGGGDTTMSDEARWRTGRKVGRTIYAQLGAEPSDDDPLIGVMDTPEIAGRVVEAVNEIEKEVAVSDTTTADKYVVIERGATGLPCVHGPFDTREEADKSARDWSYSRWTTDVEVAVLGNPEHAAYASMPGGGFGGDPCFDPRRVYEWLERYEDILRSMEHGSIGSKELAELRAKLEGE